MPGPSEWLIVIVVGVILLFGAKKLPDMARGLGQSMRIFKAETRGLKEDGSPREGGETRRPAPPPPAQQLPSPVPAQEAQVAPPLERQPGRSDRTG